MPSQAARTALFGIAQEQVPESEAVVHGKLPSWLSGSLIVNGGGDYSHMNHMFDGYALLTKVRVQDGQAWGSQRYLDTSAYASYKDAGRVVIREFATRPELSGPLEELRALLVQLFRLATNTPNFTDNASVSLHQVGPEGGQLLALSETPVASYLVDPTTLATTQQVQYGDGVPGSLTTAHPSRLSDGSLINLSRTLPGGGCHVYRQDPVTLKRTQVGFVADRRPFSPAWMHDFAATDKYAVLLEQPLYMNLASLTLGTSASHLFMDWAPEDDVLVHLVALDGSGDVRSFTFPSFFFFHVGNAFESEDGRYLHVDLAAYEDPQILKDLLLQPLVAPTVSCAGQLEQQVSQSCYKRLSIPLDPAAANSKLKPLHRLVERTPEHAGQHLNALDFCEFPAINSDYRGKPYRYMYCLSAVRPTNMGNALTKFDLAQGTAMTWHSPGGAVGEPVFVARPGATAEDDGVVVAPGVTADGAGLMLVLDAHSWNELAQVELPFSVPNRFHGLWLKGTAST
eukprot:gene13764-13883_t